MPRARRPAPVLGHVRRGTPAPRAPRRPLRLHVLLGSTASVVLRPARSARQASTVPPRPSAPTPALVTALLGTPAPSAPRLPRPPSAPRGSTAALVPRRAHRVSRAATEMWGPKPPVPVLGRAPWVGMETPLGRRRAPAWGRASRGSTATPLARPRALVWGRARRATSVPLAPRPPLRISALWDASALRLLRRARTALEEPMEQPRASPPLCARGPVPRATSVLLAPPVPLPTSAVPDSTQAPQQQLV